MSKIPIGPDGRYILPKLSAEDLRALYYQCPAPETRALLWEVFRLRVLVIRADQLQRMMGSHCHTSTLQVLESLRAELRGEPCIREQEANFEEVFGSQNTRQYTRQRKKKD